MIEQVNLLDNVFYIHNKCVYEVIIVSKVYETRETDDWHHKYKAVNIIFIDEVIGVSTENLYYTRKEAYEELLKYIEKEISKKERYVQETQFELNNLEDKRKSLKYKIVNEPPQ